MSGKETKLDIGNFDNKNDGNSDKWDWKEINPKFALFTFPLPVVLILIGTLNFYECDFTLNIWIIITGILIQIELIYISIYYQRRKANSTTELDLDDAIFENYEGGQSVKDPILKKAYRLHAKIGVLAFFGVAKCYFIISEGSDCSGLVFWPGLIMSLFYCISLAVIVTFAIRKANRRKILNIH
uniref:DUF3278 domain-containing protein n=1 Tax=Caenorhabditis tropicalis TaxID=1561998 RepID=A0A1I7SXT4_9PELO